MKIRALALLLATHAIAQTAPDGDLGPARQRLAQALAKAQSLTNTAFTVQWKQPELPAAEAAEADDTTPAVQAFKKRMQASRSGAAQGSFHPEMLWLEFQNDTADTLLILGRWILARDNQRPWCLRSGRFADGNAVPFLPDPVLLLRSLANLELPVNRRAISEHDERPLEVLSITLNREQASSLQWVGVLPPTLVGGSDPMIAMVVQRGMGQGGRAAPPGASAPLDLAITMDPATGRLHRLHFRSWQEGVQIQAGRAAVLVGIPPSNANDSGDEELEDSGAGSATLEFDRGLPLRKGRNLEPFDFEIVFQRHGEQPAPELDAAMKQLLGR